VSPIESSLSRTFQGKVLEKKRPAWLILYWLIDEATCKKATTNMNE